MSNSCLSLALWTSFFLSPLKETQIFENLLSVLLPGRPLECPIYISYQGKDYTLFSIAEKNYPLSCQICDQYYASY